MGKAALWNSEFGGALLMMNGLFFDVKRKNNDPHYQKTVNNMIKSSRMLMTRQ